MSTRTKLVGRFGAFAASVAGALILLEMFIMISPFILYYYGVYGPVMSLLHRSPWTAWLTAFFLPHLVSFPPMPDLVKLGSLIFVVGLVAFLVKPASSTTLNCGRSRWRCVGFTPGFGTPSTSPSESPASAFSLPWSSRSIALCVWPTSLILSVGLALLLRSGSVQAIPKLFLADGTIAAVPLSAREASGAAAFLAEALRNRDVYSRLGQGGGFLVLVVENDEKLHHVLIDLGMERREAQKFSGAGVSAVVSRAVSPTGTVLSGEELPAAGTALEPTFMVTAAAGGGTRIVDLAPDQFRGNRAAPLF